MKNKNISTAIVLIIIGTLCLLKSLEIVDFKWWALFRLWPLILIWIGLKFIPLHDTWKLIFKVLVLLLGVFLLFVFSNSNCCYVNHYSFNKKFNCNEKHIYTTCNNTDSYDTYIFKTAIDDDVIYDEAKLVLTASAGSLFFTPGQSLFSVDKNENSMNFFVKVEKEVVSDNKAKITASLSPQKDFSKQKAPKYNILLSDIPVWEIALELNATGNVIDLSAFKIKNLEVDANASAVDLKLGNKCDNVKVNINSNASSVKLKLPKDMKCILKKDNTLSSLNVPGLAKQEDGTYISEDEIEIVGTIQITLDANVSSVDVKRY